MPRPKGSKNKKKSETTVNMSLRKRTSKDSPPVLAPEPKKLCVEKSPNRDQGKQQDSDVTQYCFICHLSLEDGEARYSKPCCPRVFHVKCLEGNKFDASSNICPECRLETVDGTSLSKPIPSKPLQTLLLAVLNRRRTEKSKTFKNHEIFEHWPRNDFTSWMNIMDFRILVEKIRNYSYSKPAEFFSDVKWILHNCSINFGPSSPVTTYAKQLVKSVKADLLDMEACYECFYGGISDKADFFLTICNPPHDIIWAKMNRCPSWPAKCLKINNGSVYVKFFKSHDIGKDIPISQCHFISKEYPNPRGYPQRVKAAFDEVLEYVHAYEKINGTNSFQFRKEVTAFTPKVKRVPKVNQISSPDVAKSGNAEQTPSTSSSQNPIHVAFSKEQSKNHSVPSNTTNSVSCRSSSGIDILTRTTTKVITSTPVVATPSDISSDDLTLGADFSNSSNVPFRNLSGTPEHPSSSDTSSSSIPPASGSTPGPSTPGGSNQNWQQTLHTTLRDVVNQGLPNRVSAMMPYAQNGSRPGVGREEISSTLISYILSLWSLVKSMPSSSQLLSQSYTELQRHKKLVESLKKENSELKKQCNDLQNAVCKLRCEATESTKKNDELQQAFNDSTNNARNVVKNIKHEVEQLCESKLESLKKDYEQKLREKDALSEDLENNLKTIKRDYELLQAEYLKLKNLQEGSPSDSSDDKDTATDEGSVTELSVEENIPNSER